MAYARSFISKSIGGKKALLIGNNNYRRGSILRCCINDAKDLGDQLRTIQFQVDDKYDLTYEQMDRLIDNFTNKIDSGDLVIFFFSGHGTQWNDQNFLLPVDDDRIQSCTDVKYRAIHVQATLDKIMNRNPSAAIIFLDCCRSYLMPNEAATKSQIRTGGLSSMEAVNGSYIAFACAANKTASDGSKNRRNGIFTSHLRQHIIEPNLTIDEVMNHVCDAVMTESNDQQCPFRVTSLRKKIYLNIQSQSTNQTPTNQQLHNNNITQIERIPYKNVKLESIVLQCHVSSKVDLSDHDLIDQDMEIIAKDIIIKKRCIQLWLGSNLITSDGVLFLADALKNNRTLERLDLHNNRISDDGVRFLVKTLSNSNNTLKILNLGQNGITNEGVQCLAEMLKTNTSLTHLYIQKNDISDEGIQILSYAIENDNKTLVELYINGNRLITDSSVDDLLSMIRNHSKLNCLHIENCNLSSTGKQKLKYIEKLKRNFQVYVNSSYN